MYIPLDPYIHNPASNPALHGALSGSVGVWAADGGGKPTRHFRGSPNGVTRGSVSGLGFRDLGFRGLIRVLRMQSP